MKKATAHGKPRAAVNPFEAPCFMESLNEAECNLIHAVRTGVWPASCYDDPDFIADWLFPDGGGTLASLKREQRLYLETEERIFLALEAILAGRAHQAAATTQETSRIRSRSRPHEQARVSLVTSRSCGSSRQSFPVSTITGGRCGQGPPGGAAFVGANGGAAALFLSCDGYLVVLPLLCGGSGLNESLGRRATCSGKLEWRATTCQRPARYTHVSVTRKLSVPPLGIHGMGG